MRGHPVDSVDKSGQSGHNRTEQYFVFICPPRVHSQKEGIQKKTKNQVWLKTGILRKSEWTTGKTTFQKPDGRKDGVSYAHRRCRSGCRGVGVGTVGGK